MVKNKKNFKKKLKNLTYRQAKKILPNLRARGDIDGDGISNKKDCRPFDKKKQGFLHDLAIKNLRKKEQQLENQRIALSKKIEDKSEKLKIKTSIRNKKLSIKKAALKQKQAVIDEINKEKNRIKKLKEMNNKIKTELRKDSSFFKILKLSKSTLDKTRKVLNDPKTKRKIQDIINYIGK